MNHVAPIVAESPNPVGVDEWVAQYQATGDSRAAERLLGQYERFIRAEAHRLARKFRLDLDDAQQEGALGFLHAASRFDLAFGSSLMTYSRSWVRARVMRLIHSRDAVDQPTSRGTDNYLLNRAIRDLRAEGVDRPTVEQLKERLPAFSIERITNVLMGVHVASMDAPLSDSANAGDLHGLLPDHRMRPDVEVEEKLTVEAAGQAIRDALVASGLSDRQRQCFEMHHLDGLGVQEVADRLGVTKQLVSMRANEAIVKLRPVLAGDARVRALLGA